MKASNHATKSSLRMVTTLAASVLAVSGLAMGTALADSNPLPLPQRSTLSAEAQTPTPQSFHVATIGDPSVASTGDSSKPYQLHSRKDGGNVTVSQLKKQSANGVRKLPPYGPQGPSFR